MRWISGSRQSMQRLGFCKMLVFDENRVRRVNDLSEVLQNNVENEFWVSPNDHLVECLNAIPKIDINRNISENKIKISLQHYYICRHPSKSGWLSRDAYKEYVEGLPRYLGLLDNTYRQTDFGQVLAKGLISQQEKEALKIVSSDINPLMLTLPQKIFFLYTLLSTDGDFLIPFLQVLSNDYGKRTFSYLEAGEIIPKVLNKLINRFTGTGYTKKAREQLKQLRSALEGVEKAITDNLEKQGSGSRREQIAIPRMEWLIDLNLAEKVASKQGSRLYRLTPSGYRFVSIISEEYDRLMKVKYAEDAMNSFLDDSFFRLAGLVFQQGVSEVSQQIDLIDFIEPAYKSLCDQSEYCSIRPLLLLANAKQMDEGKPVIGYQSMLEAIEEAYRKNPERVYYTVTRTGTDYQLRLFT